jgi:uncharacterized protein
MQSQSHAPVLATENIQTDQMIKSPFPTIPDEYYQRIQGLIKDLEKEHDITILYMCENGSRVQGIWHTDSDCDLRFIFKHNDKITYTGLGKARKGISDTIEGYSEDRVLDWQGWGIEKAVQAISHSNPSILEFLHSSIRYVSVDNFHTDCLKIVRKMHNTKSMYYHYLNMGKKNWKEHIIDSDNVPKNNVLYKKYMYILRPIFMVMYIMSPGYNVIKNDQPIINDFFELMDQIKKIYQFDQLVLTDIETVIRMKKTDKKYQGPGLKALNQWIRDFFVSEDQREQYERIEKKEKKEKKDELNFQTINSTKCKLEKEIGKINALSMKNKTISRNDYISLFSQYLMFMWLIQHPGSTPDKSHCDNNELLDQIQINDRLRQWITGIIMNENDIVENDQSELILDTRKMITYTAIEQIINGLRLIAPNDPMIRELQHISETDIILDENGIEMYFKNLLLIAWALKNEKMGKKIPSDVFSDKDVLQVIPKNTLDSVRHCVSELRPKYVCPIDPECHQMIQNDLKENEKYIREAGEKHAKKKESERQDMYKNALIEVDPDEFMDLLRKYY